MHTASESVIQLTNLYNASLWAGINSIILQAPSLINSPMHGRRDLIPAFIVFKLSSCGHAVHQRLPPPTRPRSKVLGLLWLKHSSLVHLRRLVISVLIHSLLSISLVHLNVSYVFCRVSLAYVLTYMVCLRWCPHVCAEFLKRSSFSLLKFRSECMYITG